MMVATKLELRENEWAAPSNPQHKFLFAFLQISSVGLLIKKIKKVVLIVKEQPIDSDACLLHLSFLFLWIGWRLGMNYGLLRLRLHICHNKLQPNWNDAQPRNYKDVNNLPLLLGFQYIKAFENIEHAQDDGAVANQMVVYVPYLS